MARQHLRASFSPSRSWLIALCVVAAFAQDAFAQERRWTRTGEVNAAGFGQSVAWVSDWDGDGQPDFAAGTTGGDQMQPPPVLVVSSATGSLLLSLSNDEPDSGFGDALFAVGDTDGDGKSELAVFAPHSIDPATGTFGSLSLWDSAGHEHWTWRPAAFVGSSPRVDVIGDVDGDSVLDLIVGYFDATTAYADIVSGATGRGIRSHADPRDPGGWVYGVGALGDCDLDGVRDYYVVKEVFPLHDLHAFSGATGAPLWTFPATRVSGVVPVEDIDVDSIGDVVVFAANAVISGGTGRFVHSLGSDWCYDAVAVDDLDGDDVGDVVMACEQGVVGDNPLIAYSLMTGLEIARETIGFGYCYDLDASVDFDGDGQVDLLCGLPQAFGAPGQVKVIGLGGWNELLHVDGPAFNSRGVGSGAALVPDRDGDGTAEIAIAVVADVEDVTSSVQIHSSIDGHELARIHVAGGIASSLLPLIGVPDVDGDLVDDWAFAAADGTVEVRSGHDDSLLLTWSLGSGTPTAVAAAVDAAGHSFVAFVTVQSATSSEIAVHDLTTGAAPLILAAKQWNSVGCLGDIDGDAALDWVACDLGVTNGKLTAFSGASGATIWTISGTKKLQNSLVRTVADLSGDGEDDVLVSSFVIDARKVVGRDGVTGVKLFELPDPAPSSNSAFGAAITPVGDLDHDGSGDFAVGAPWVEFFIPYGFVDLYSGKTARLLGRINEWDWLIDDWDSLETDRLGERFAELARGTTLVLRNQGRRQPALVVAAPTAGMITDQGRVDLIALSDLFLEFYPEVGVEGSPVDASTRGGKPGALAGLYIVAIDGVPVDQFGVFGALDSFGEWTATDDVPPGFSGTVFTLRSYAIGNDDRLSRSVDETLTIQ